MLIIGEYLSTKDEGKPFNSPSGKMFLSWLRESGIEPRECEFENVISTTVSGPSAFLGGKDQSLPKTRSITRGKYLRREFFPQIERIQRIVETTSHNLVLLLDGLPLWALTEERNFKFARGRITSGYAGKKVLPTFSATQIISDWSSRPVLFADLDKARREDSFSGFNRPQRHIHLSPSIEDLEAFYQTYIESASAVSCDIETKGQMITCVGFAPNKTHALVIPFFDETQKDGNYWRTAREEYIAWQFVRRVLRTKPSYGQNFQYDMQYLWRQMGIKCPLFCDDTMLLHHALQPEMQKGLGFLASVYTDEFAWKFMHKIAASTRGAKKGDGE